MVGKSRSGLANDRRAYGCNINCATKSICSSLTTISLVDIASVESAGWLLNGNTTLLLCDVLEIPAGQTLLPNGFTLTNNGTINVRGQLRNVGGVTDTSTITINNGTINVFSTGSIAVSIAAFGALATFTNNGLIHNNGDIFCQTFGVINNTSSGRINNNSANEGGTGGFRLNPRGTFNNSGVFINNTGATITLTSAFDYKGIIYNYSGGTITNNGIINNAGTINNANGLSTCGVGTLTGSGTITNTGTIGTACPP